MQDIFMIRRWSLAACGLLIGLAAAAPASAQGTDEQRKACAPDAARLCREFFPNVEKITACMTAKQAELSTACRDAMLAATPASPAAAASHKNARAARAERRAERKAARSAKASCEMAKGHKRYKNCKPVRAAG